MKLTDWTSTTMRGAIVALVTLSPLLMGQSLSANDLVPRESERFFRAGREEFDREIQNLLARPAAEAPVLDIDEAVYLDEQELKELETAPPLGSQPATSTEANRV